MDPWWRSIGAWQTRVAVYAICAVFFGVKAIVDPYVIAAVLAVIWAVMVVLTFATRNRLRRRR